MWMKKTKIYLFNFSFMYTTMQDAKKNKKTISSLLVVCLSIAIAFFFTKDQYYQYLGNQDMLETTKKEVTEKKSMLEALEKVSKSIDTDAVLKGDMEKYASDFREDTILESIFTPMRGVGISNLSMARGEKLPNGLSMANISLSFRTQDIATLSKFFEYLTTGKANKKSYIIKSFSFPFDTTKNDPISSTVELGMYYME